MSLKGRNLVDSETRLNVQNAQQLRERREKKEGEVLIICQGASRVQVHAGFCRQPGVREREKDEAHPYGSRVKVKLRRGEVKEQQADWAELAKP